jgi:prephenate dehydrogenase
MKIGVIGLGLIGGSLAKSIKRTTKHEVLGYDIRETAMLKAELLNAIDGRLTEDALAECDIAIVALFPRDAVEYILQNRDRFGEGALVVDCSGVKRAVCAPIEEALNGEKFTFMGGHPMAGREFWGFDYAKDDLFENASMILTPAAGTPIEIIKSAKDFFLSIGFGRVRFSTPDEHDEMIAFTSQLAHIVSSAYVRSPLSMKHKGFSAGSFLDMTRVARLNEHMWTELFFENADKLSEEVGRLADRLSEYKRALDARDEEGMRALLREGREAKEALDE